MRLAIAGAALAAVVSGRAALATDYRSTGDPASVLYDAPSLKAKPLFVLGRDTPLEIIVQLEGWVKVRDSTGTIGWVSERALTEKRMVVVRTPVAEVLANPDPAAPLVFRAENGVLLEVAEPATSAATTAAPGWVRVRHRDGQSGYVRIAQIFGI